MKVNIELIKDGRPVVIEQADNGVITIQYTLSDVNESGCTQVVLIHLTENVEVIVPHVADEAHVIIGANERAVARVELSEGVVQPYCGTRRAVPPVTTRGRRRSSNSCPPRALPHSSEHGSAGRVGVVTLASSGAYP